MQTLAYHFAAGTAWFSGAALIVIALGVAWSVRRRSVQRACRLTAFVGALFAALSATPAPYWLYAVWGTAFVAWLVAGLPLKKEETTKRHVAVNLLLTGVSLAAVLMELPYRFTPAVEKARYDALYVIGDSISAGMGPKERTWPRQFADRYDVKVVDLSHPGATTGSALQKIPEVQDDRAIVLIEIGGNDILGSTSASQFARDLDKLLAGLSGPQRELFLMELPLPPFCNEFGRTQRTLAAKYHVKLIPKRHLMNVLAGHHATLDGLHLSETGHRNMATLVWSCLGGALAKGHSSP